MAFPATSALEEVRHLHTLLEKTRSDVVRLEAEIIRVGRNGIDPGLLVGAAMTSQHAVPVVGIGGQAPIQANFCDVVEDCGSPSRDAANACGSPVSGSCDSSNPYSGHGGFSFAPTNSFAAGKAGFFSSSRPPELGVRVVCFRREHWQRIGVVIRVEDEVCGGTDGLRIATESARVTVQDDDGETFQCWAVYFAPVNDMEYSSVCTTGEFRASKFQELFFWPRDGGSDNACGLVSDIQAQESLRLWLRNILDAKGEPLEVPKAVQEELFHIFNEQPDPSIHLYSRHTRLGPARSPNKGQDYSVYYLALNNTLNHDESLSLLYACPLIRHMIYRLLFTRVGSRKVLHPGGRVWKGDSEAPVPINMRKLKDACRDGTVVRFRQFQSTTADETVAHRFKKRNDRRGYLWTIDIPSGFWGARDIAPVAWKEQETETLFPPYSAFLVEAVDDEGCHLRAVDKYHDCRALAGVTPDDTDLERTIS